MSKDQKSHPVDKGAPETLIVARKHERKGDRHKRGGLQTQKENQKDLEVWSLRLRGKSIPLYLVLNPWQVGTYNIR